jgi:tRNA 2-selenouridine synthase
MMRISLASETVGISLVLLLACISLGAPATLPAEPRPRSPTPDLRGGPGGARRAGADAPAPRRPRNVPVATCDWRFGTHVGGYSAIIDVRTPAEFAVDHVPGALNLPVLSDLERHRVGLLFASAHFEGRKLGAQLISANIAQLFAAHFADKPSTYCPLIYCWRGGQRSNSLAHVLCEVGFRCSVLQGGYRAFRRSVVRLIARAPSSLNFRVMTGPTGSGKTALLHYLLRKGHQVLDLEALANHRGSVLGATATAQPSQKAFESLLAQALLSLKPDSPVFVEDEASFIGALHIPSPLWRYAYRYRCRDTCRNRDIVVDIDVDVYAFIYVCIFVCIYVCVHIHTQLCVYTHTHTYSLSLPFSLSLPLSLPLSHTHSGHFCKPHAMSWRRRFTYVCNTRSHTMPI